MTPDPEECRILSLNATDALAALLACQAEGVEPNCTEEEDKLKMANQACKEARCKNCEKTPDFTIPEDCLNALIAAIQDQIAAAAVKAIKTYHGEQTCPTLDPMPTAPPAKRWW